jgi:transposase
VWRSCGARREVPVSERVDDEVFVTLPDACPGCGGGVEFQGVWQQYQEDIPPPPKTIVRRYDIAYGCCRCCGRRVRGRHPDQTSDAVGACAAQIGPRAVARAAQLHKELGLPVKKTAQVLLELCELRVTPCGLYQALHRQARAAAATYQALVEGARASPAVAADETGWRVAGWRQWLWDFVEHEQGYTREEGRDIDLPFGFVRKKTQWSRSGVIFEAEFPGGSRPVLPDGLCWYSGRTDVADDCRRADHEWRREDISRGDIHDGLRDRQADGERSEEGGLNLGGKFEEQRDTIWRLDAEFPSLSG